MRPRAWKLLVVVLIVLATIACDQATKQVARSRLAGQGTVRVIGTFLVLHYVENEGAFLSLGATLPRQARMAAFIAFPLAIVALMIVFLVRRKTFDWRIAVGLAFVAGGGAGNLIDRLLRAGRVSDFMNVGIGVVRSGIFNFADLAIIAGCIVLLFSSRERARPADT